MTDTVRCRIGELRWRSSELKSAKDYRGAILLHIEIIGLLEKHAGPRRDLAHAQNYASVLYLRSGLYHAAEHHARLALRLTESKTAGDLEERGCYHIVLAQCLAAQYRFEEALIFADNATRDYGESGFHTPPDRFLRQIQAEAEQIRNRTWSPPTD